MSKLAKALTAAAGNAGGGESLYVEDVFSTYLYEGNGSVQAIENGIALRGLPTDGVYVHLNAETVTNVAPSSIGVLFNNVLRSDERPKFGTKSYKFISASTSYLYLSEPVIDSSDSFCVETWAYFTGDTGASTNMQMIAAQYKAGDAGRMLFGGQSGQVVVRVNGATVYLSGAVSADTWHHIAWTYDGTTHRLFVDGNLEDSTASMPNIFTGVNTQIGGTDESLLAGYNLDGFLDEFRITKGKPRYVSNFSVPTSAFTEDVDDGTGHGGMVWFKNRDDTNDHYVTDTEISPVDLRKNLNTNNTDSAVNSSGMSGESGWGHSGFSVGPVNFTNNLGKSYASWTFRKAEKFFDVVTYTGDGTYGRALSHNLGSVPAVAIIKRTDGTGDWLVYHKDAGSLQSTLRLNTTQAVESTNYIFYTGSGDLTDTTFGGLGGYDFTNFSGATYVAYLFASDAGGFGDDGSESIIKCGSFTASTGAEVDLGFEPQWVLLRSTTSVDDWYMFDNMRGWGADRGSNDSWLLANTSGAEFNNTNSLGLTPTGFTSFNGGNQTYIYIAIRRPMKTPESGTEVFSPVAFTGDGVSGRVINAGFSVDTSFGLSRSTTFDNSVLDRIRGNDQFLYTQSTIAEATKARWAFDEQDGIRATTIGADGNNSGDLRIHYFLKRATGFFDLVAYTGNGGEGYQVPHNLKVSPELIIIKRRNNASAEGWFVGAEFSSTNFTQAKLNTNAASVTSLSYTISSIFKAQPTASNFTLGNYQDVNNSSADTYIAYLFATLDGVSKVGSYTGTGADLNVDCGFSAGARFVLIKRTDSTGDWYVWDSARGIVAGNDPYLLFNTDAVEVTPTDYIDPLNAGFTVTSSAPTSLNASGGTYIFLAIA